MTILIQSPGRLVYEKSEIALAQPRQKLREEEIRKQVESIRKMIKKQS